jgi:hypothetical protein
MATSTPRIDRRSDRKTDRQDAIVEALRRQIVCGELAPGSRLPNRVDIERDFNASSITVQRALERLKSEGFVVASRRNGTHVVHKPPHLNHYALVFPADPKRLEWNRFWAALCEEAVQLSQGPDRKLPIYYNVDGHLDCEDYLNLERAVRAHRLAGIIFGSNPDCLRNSPLLDEPGIPRVAIMTGSDTSTIPAVHPDANSFFEMALDHVASRGLRRLAVLVAHGSKQEFEPGIAARGLITRSYWVQRISLWTPETARGVVHLLMNPAQTERPEALIIADDNLIAPALHGLADAGIRIPHDLELIAHCNFPPQQPKPVPMQRLGYVVREVLQTCIDSIDRQRAGETVPYNVPIRARFEEEVGNVNG